MSLLTARSNRSVRRLVALAGALFTLASAPLCADLLVVEVKTDYLPGEDFISAHVQACRHPAGTHCVEASRSAFSTETSSYLVGHRIAEFDVAAGHDYMVTVLLLGSGGNTRASQRVIVNFDGPFVTTVLIVKPQTEATKKSESFVDRDGDGRLSDGDILRYEVRLERAERFTDTPGPGGRLVAGSVVTSHGTVDRGNAAGDTSIQVDDLEEAGSAPVTITFDVEVDGVVVNQGTAWVDGIGQDRRTAIVPTDDPDTPDILGDPTIRRLECSIGDCMKRLGACEAARKTCEAARQRLQDQLDAITADPDGDRVPAVLDLCLSTPAGAAIDDRGCSQDQFCRRINLFAPSGAAICRRADWKSDEPLDTNPHDCRPSGTACVQE